MENNNPQQQQQDNRMSQEDRGAAEKGGRSFGGGGGGGGAGGRGRFGRRKVCPFIMDKTLVLDYKNLKVVYRFVTETGKIVPRHVSGVTAKNQRKLAKHIKRARSLGLVAPLIAE